MANAEQCFHAVANVKRRQLVSLIDHCALGDVSWVQCVESGFLVGVHGSGIFAGNKQLAFHGVDREHTHVDDLSLGEVAAGVLDECLAHLSDGEPGLDIAIEADSGTVTANIDKNTRPC